MAARSFDGAGVRFQVKNSEWICAARGVGRVVIKSTLEYYRQPVEISFTFDHVIIGASFQCGHGSLFIADASDDHYRDWDGVFAYTIEQKKAVAVVQLHIGEHEIERF